MSPKIQHIIESDGFRLAIFAIEEQDPWKLVARVPKSVRYMAWRSPNGDFSLGISESSFARALSGGDLADFEATLKANDGIFWGPDAAAMGLIAFVASAFDRGSEAVLDGWRGYPGTEIWIPKILIRRIGLEWKMLIYSMIDEVNDAFHEALQLLNSETDSPASLDAQELTTTDSRSDYASWVQKALDQIQNGTLQKVVLARKQRFERDSPFDVSQILSRLDERFPDCFVFAHAPESGPVFLGASPERLVSSSDGQLHTEALAGSAPRSASDSHDERLGEELLKSEKDVREHEHVREYIRARIMPICESIDLAPMALKRLSNVQHLHTKIVARLSPSHTLLHAADLLHPTPAVAGTPTKEALEFIQETEDFARGWYAGTLGWVAPEEVLAGELCVAIRSALVEGNCADLFAGAGIVEGSDPIREERETRVKMQALLEALT